MSGRQNRGRFRNAIFSAVLLLFGVAAPLSAGIEIKRFYAAKERSTHPRAWVRARERLLAVRPGMSEIQFLEAMGLKVLEKRGQAFDVLMDGYLAESSRLANERRPSRETRFVVLGFTTEGREQPHAEVRLDERRVAAVRWLGKAPPVLLATSSEQLFYSTKKRSTDRSTWVRVGDRLDGIEVGMPEMAFLDAMNLQILAPRGVPIDALLEGYLAEASRRMNEADPSARYLVFGWIERGSEVAKTAVRLRDNRVSGVRPLP